jgi:alpha-galactosidase
MAWQFNRPEAGEGMVQAFRRPKSDITSMRFRLRGLEPGACYSVTELEKDGTSRSTVQTTIRGDELMEKGLPVCLPAQPDSALIVYKRCAP